MSELWPVCKECDYQETPSSMDCKCYGLSCLGCKRELELCWCGVDESEIEQGEG